MIHESCPISAPACGCELEISIPLPSPLTLVHQVNSLRYTPTRVAQWHFPALLQKPVRSPLLGHSTPTFPKHCRQEYLPKHHIKEKSWVAMIYSNSLTRQLRASVTWPHSPFKTFSTHSVCFVKAKHVFQTYYTFPTSLTWPGCFLPLFEVRQPNQSREHASVTHLPILLQFPCWNVAPTSSIWKHLTEFTLFL